jgi:hypothetical protein
MILLATIALLVFYVTKSVAEGYYFHAKSKTRIPAEKYQHWVLTAIRIPVWVLFYLATNSMLLTCSLVLIFPFIHDGLYYLTRNKLNPFVYPEGFWDNPNPKTSNAVMDFNLIQRSLLCLSGLLIITILLITGTI